MVECRQPHYPGPVPEEVMDWSLVLASQEIEAMIVRTEAGWGLAVEEARLRAGAGGPGQYRRKTAAGAGNNGCRVRAWSSTGARWFGRRGWRRFITGRWWRFPSCKGRE